MQQQNIEELQNLLLNEIIGKNYDSEKFEQFVNQKYPEKDDISSWTYEELYQQIQQFQEQENRNVKPQNSAQQQQLQNNQQIAPQQRRSKLIPQVQPTLAFKNTLTVEQALKRGFNDEEMKILGQILEPRRFIQFDDKISFSEYTKLVNCQQKIQYIEENIEINFKITLIEKKQYLCFSSDSVFCIQTQPFNWKVERTKEDFETLEKLFSTYLPEYLGYISKYDEKEKYEKYLENTLKYYLSKPKARSLIYILLFLNDDSAKQYHTQPFSYYKKNQKKFTLEDAVTSSGQLTIDFSKENFQNYLQLSRFQKEFTNNFGNLEKQFNQSQQIINQEIKKMKDQVKEFQKFTNRMYILENIAQRQRESTLNLFLNNITNSIQLNEEIQSFISATINNISQKLSETIRTLQLPLNKCQERYENIRSCYNNQFTPTKKVFLNNSEVQKILKLCELKSLDFTNSQYEIISSILHNVFPLQVDVNYDVLQKHKDEFAYLITQVFKEGQICVEKLLKDINIICKKNFSVLQKELQNFVQQ